MLSLASLVQLLYLSYISSHVRLIVVSEILSAFLLLFPIFFIPSPPLPKEKRKKVIQISKKKMKMKKKS